MGEFGELQALVKLYHTELFSGTRGGGSGGEAAAAAGPFPPGKVGGGGSDHTMYDHPADAAIAHPDFRDGLLAAAERASGGRSPVI